jgi:prolipoprotein diacylglyceryltransferase/protein-S-isoprenylcysteine O-methyltransferase Ste14
MGVNGVLARLAYGALFTVLAPAALGWWAWASAANVPLPVPDLPRAGWVVAGSGLLLMVVGMHGLWRFGGGLPMNAFPPPRLVVRGVFALIPHPIYCGFVAVVAGGSLVAGSASGLWLVTPCTALALWALAVGYERVDLLRRFGALPRPWLAPPADDDDPPSPGKRLGVALAVFAPWLVLYEAVHALGAPPDAVSLFLPGEAAHPVWTWAEWIYASAYLVPLAVLAPRRNRDLRRFAVQGWTATGVLSLVYLCVPVTSPALPFVPEGLAGRLLAQERAWSRAAVAAFPSFHVVWACLAAAAVRRRARGAGIAAWLWAGAVAASCVATGMHAALDVVAGLAAAVVFLRLDALWDRLRRAAERVANARREWRFGPVRVINHGLYAGLGGATGVWLIACLTGGRDLWAVPTVALAALVGAALWAQQVEGAPHLLRPFGYYGAIYGGLLGLLAAWAAGADARLLLGAFAAAAPFIQAWGRLRCLVQGCCHGCAAPPWLGIVYTQPQSRVVTLAKLGGVPLHATQLYSILGNLAIGALLMRLWCLGLTPSAVAGLYLILSAAARFVEESYRGEPQTIHRAGLPIYQWLALLSALGGIALTTWTGPAAPAPVLASVGAGAVALGFGLFSWLAMGVDLPTSTVRFARLT